MSSQWIQQEWDDVCQRLRQCADSGSSQSVQQQAEQFTHQPPPSNYQELLERVSEAARLAIDSPANDPLGEHSSKESVKLSDPEPFDPEHGVVDALDEAGIETFPASDPSAHY